MKTPIWTIACGIVGVMTVAMAGQTPSQQPSSPTQQPGPPAQQSAGADKQITITGCLQAAPSTGAPATPGATGTTGAAGAAGGATDAADAGAKFVLANAKASSPADSAGAAAGAAGAAGATESSSGPAKTYRLVANPAALTPHVGKKLELTGTLDETSSSPAQSASSGPALRVLSGKVIAASCNN
jgi:hypothetical protein